MSQDINVRIVINTRDSVRNVSDVKSEVKELDAQGSRLQVNMNNHFSRIGNIAQVAMGNVIANVVAGLQRQFTQLASNILNVANETSQYADKIDKMRERTGIAANELQRLEFVSEQTGVSFSVFDSVSASVTRRLNDFRNGTGRAGQAIQQLGINVEDADGNLREKGGIIRELISELSNMENAAERDALAMDVLGRSSQQLAPLLNQSSEEINRMFRESERLNMEMSDRAIAASVQYGDELNKLQRQMNGFTRRMGASVAEGLIPFVQMASRALSVLDEMTDRTPRLSRSFIELREETENLNTRSMPLIERYQELADKAELNSVEQEEMISILSRLGSQLPATALQFNDYGQVIGLNTQRSKEFIEQQNLILRLRTQQEFESQARSLVQLAQRYEEANERRKQFEAGDAPVFDASFGFVRLPDADETIDSIRNLREQIILALQNIKDLGRSIDDEIEPFEALIVNSDGAMEKLSISIAQVAKDIGLKTVASEEAAQATEDATNKEIGSIENLSDRLDQLKTKYSEIINAAEMSATDQQRAVALLRQIEEIEREIQRRIRSIEGITVRPNVEIEIPEEQIADDFDSMPDVELQIGFPIESIADMRQQIRSVEEEWTLAATDEERARLSARLDALDLELEAKIQGVETEDLIREEAHERQMMRMQEMFSFMQSGMNGIARIQSNFAQSNINNIQQERQERLRSINEQLQNANLTEEQRRELIKKRGQTEEEFDDKLRDARRRQAVSEKNMAKMQVLVETARAIMAAAPNPAAIATTMALGAIQLTAVMTAPMPTFRSGGRVNARVSNGEFLVDPQTYQRNPRLFQRINSGFITGPGTGTSDSIMADLPDNSFVVNAESTRRNRDFLQSLATGGEVGSPQMDMSSLGEMLRDVLKTATFKLRGKDLYASWDQENELRKEKYIRR